MLLSQDVNDIMKDLLQQGVIDSSSKLTTKMNGTTDGLVYTLTVNEVPTYVLKLDRPENITWVELLHQSYKKSKLLPELLYTAPTKTYFVYAYLEGTTHYHRGSKINWLTLLVEEFLNYYEIYEQTEMWGMLVKPRDSWREFNERGLEGARNNVGSLLPIEDYHKVKSLLDGISEVGRKYLLHGDTGVHNFVFHDSRLTGVIDPSPIVGPVSYDFTYAFCSSPDDLNLETLFVAYDLLRHEPMDKERLIAEVILQLYCRIGICVKFHPHDLAGYLKAWDYWKILIPSSN